MIFDNLPTVAAVAFCLLLGGILKGATGAGAPLLAVPAIALLFDVPFAIVVMVIPDVFRQAGPAVPKVGVNAD